MATIAEMARRFDVFSVEDAAVAAIEETKDHLADLNVEQMNKGFKSDGTVMPDYSEISVEEFGKPEGPIKLFDKGDFYRGWRVEVSATAGVIITSTDEKTDMLFKRYATKKSNLFGLSAPFRREYVNEFLRRNFRKQIKSGVGL